MDENLSSPQIEISDKKNIFKKNALLTAGVVFIFISTFFYLFFIGNFRNFPEGKIVYVKKGMGLKTVVGEFKNAKVTPSEILLMTTIIMLQGENKVVAGPYFFSHGEGAFFLAKRLVSGDFKVKALKITIPEGFTTKQIAERMKERIAIFDEEAFLKIVQEKEGYIFPDTYFFLPDVSPEEAALLFSNTFDEKISSIKKEIIASGKTLEEIIKMASIIEKEVKGLSDKKIVAGILWKRISIGMPLQVDATLAYERGKTSAELSTEDLRENSPYNSYTNRGLPPTPISNPGLDSIVAAVEPAKTSYLYFLTDSEGNVHYAKDFEGHKLNKQKFIK